MHFLLFQGDSGGPLWVREEQGGPWPIAYLVSKEFILFLYRAIQRIYSSEIPLTYSQVGVVSSGSGAGHCAGANRPGGLVDIVINYDNDDIFSL